MIPMLKIRRSPDCFCQLDPAKINLVIFLIATHILFKEMYFICCVQDDGDFDQDCVTSLNKSDAYLHQTNKLHYNLKQGTTVSI